MIAKDKKINYNREEGNFIDVEIQKRNEGNIPKRTRFYQALLDTPFLKSEEIPGLPLGDDCKKVILNTKGSNDNEVERSLIDFLHYVENSGENRDGFTYEDNRD